MATQRTALTGTRCRCISSGVMPAISFAVTILLFGEVRRHGGEDRSAGLKEAALRLIRPTIQSAEFSYISAEEPIKSGGEGRDSNPRWCYPPQPANRLLP